MKTPPKTTLAVTLATVIALSCRDRASNTDAPYQNQASAAATYEILPVGEVDWEPLNPARGDKSPRAGTLWGDRNGTVPTGFLAKFVDGFSSPPHIHNVTYRAVVIRGQIHNDDPTATPMWMPPGSFWTQPKGEIHITSAQGPTNVALVEIDQGPYLVRPPVQAFDSGERPINIHPSNLVWVDDRTYLWGSLEDGQSRGIFIRLRPDATTEIHNYGSVFRGVVITGELEYLGNKNDSLEPGSYFGSNGAYNHKVRTHPTDETIVYIRTNGRFTVSMD